MYDAVERLQDRLVGVGLITFGTAQASLLTALVGAGIHECTGGARSHRAVRTAFRGAGVSLYATVCIGGAIGFAQYVKVFAFFR